MPLRIANRASGRIPIDLSGLSPEKLRDQSLDDIRRLKVRRGNQELRLGELFAVDGDPRDMRWQLEGDFTAVHGIGARITAGEIEVEGAVGRHAGAGMSGGRLLVRGDAGDHLGAEMRGGFIRVHCNAGDHVGAAYAGSRRGMSGGTILIHGGAGGSIGHRMRRGLIAVGGDSGPWLGMHMLAGSIFVFGNCGAHPGLGMRRGTIGLFGPDRPELLPTFRPGYRGPLQLLHLIEKSLHDQGFDAARLRNLAGAIELFHGDTNELGRGEIIASA